MIEMIALGVSQQATCAVALFVFAVFENNYGPTASTLTFVTGTLRQVEEIFVYIGMLYVMYKWRRVPTFEKFQLDKVRYLVMFPFFLSIFFLFDLRKIN